jgi:alpha-galactosidase
LFGGTILPVGAAPDGVSWTGFVSLLPGGKAGTLLLFRELGEAAARVRLPGLAVGQLHCQRLAGTGRVQIVDGQALVREVEPLGYLLAHFEA